jgi:glucokinase
MSDGAILVGDVGGTHVRFAMARTQGAGVTLSEVWKRPNREFRSFDDALSAYLHVAPERAAGGAIGAAGAVSGGKVELLNHNWSIDAGQVGKRIGLGADAVVLVNDFMAMARSAPALSGEETSEIAHGVADPGGSIAVGGPGTGFGIGVLRRLIGASGYVVVGGEGGHQLYSPQTELEWRMAEGLRSAGVYVSNEIVAAGAGFKPTLDALAKAMGVEPKDWSPADVVARAEAGDAFALEFCRVRARCAMSALGNLALMSNAQGGVFVAGGVSVRIERWLKEPAALARFRERGPRSELVKAIPIRLVTSETAPLKGAALLWSDRQSRGWL